MIRRLAVALVLIVAPAEAGELAPTGTLRAVFLAQNPVQAKIDPATGAVRGPAAALTEALAKRQGIPFRIEGLPGTAAVIEAVKSGAADIGFLAIDPARAEEVAFSQPYSLAHNTYAVKKDSPIRSAAELDKPGIRIGVGERDAADLYLTRTLKSAELKRNKGGDLAVAARQLASGEIDAYAANRQRLETAAPTYPDLRVLPENFLAVQQAIALTKGDDEKRALVDRFIDEARSSGLIAEAISRADLRGVDVAPARK